MNTMLEERQTIVINSCEDWRSWLEKHHQSVQSVWIICNTKKSGLPAVSWSDLVDVALCFGWIDSTRKSIDANSFKQLFSKRKHHGTWSKINKEKVQKLIDANLMHEAGFESIRIAKLNGAWTILDSVEELIIPVDLHQAFKQHADSEAYFSNLSKSLRKMMLQWIALAKRPETRQRRITEIVINAMHKNKPKQFR